MRAERISRFSVAPHSSDQLVIGSAALAATLAIWIAPREVLFVVGASVLTYFAYNYPAATIALLILVGQVAQFEMHTILGVEAEGIPVGSLWLRLSDPIMLGIAGSLVARLVSGSSTMRAFLRDQIFLVIFVVYLLIQGARNMGSYGVNAIGEFRTYYQFFLLLPYIAVVATPKHPLMKLFKIVTFLGLLHIPIALVRAAVLYDFTFAAYDKWLSGFGSLSLLYALFAFYVGQAQGVWRHSVLNALVYLAGIAVIIIASTRSVWLSGAVGLLILLISTERGLKNIVKAFLAVGIVTIILTPLFEYSGLRVTEFISLRLLAFTNYESDPTSSWRFYFWLATLNEISKDWIVGFGLGRHFSVFIPEFGETVTTSPHNLFLAILFHGGVIGLVLYGLWVLKFVNNIRKGLHSFRRIPVEGIVALIVLVSMHAYAVAYTFEKGFLLWCYLGLGASLILQMNRQESIAKVKP